MKDGQPTGRLFRSLHAQSDLAIDAVVALDLDDAVTLRSVSLRDASPLEPAIDPDFEHLFAPLRPDATGDTGHAPGDDPAVETIDRSEADDIVSGSFAGASPQPTTASPWGGVQVTESSRLLDGPGIPGWAAVSVITGATFLVGIADVIVTGQLGWLTGIGLLLASIYAAWGVRPKDAYWVLVSPPLASLFTVVTVGQATVSEGNFWVRQGLLIPFTLGRSVAWILAATVLAGVIVAARRRRLLLT